MQEKGTRRILLAGSAAALAGCTAPKESAARTPEDDLYFALSPLDVFPNSLRFHPQGIRQTSYVLGRDSITTDIFVLHENGGLYRSAIVKHGEAVQFSKFKRLPIAQSPLPRAQVFHTFDGSTFVAGSGSEGSFSPSPLAVWYENSNRWETVAWGGRPAIVESMQYVKDIDSYLVRTRNSYAEISLLLFKIDPKEKREEVTTLKQRSFIRGTNGQSLLYTVDTKAETIKVANTGEFLQGIDVYTFDYKTGTELERKTLASGVRGITAITMFRSTTGNIHAIAANQSDGKLYDLNLDISGQTLAVIPYGEWLAKKGIKEAGPSRIFDLEVTEDFFGQQHVWIGGEYKSSTEKSPRPFLAHYAIDYDQDYFPLSFPYDVYDLGRHTRKASRVDKDGIQLISIFGRPVLDVTISDFGKIFFPLTDRGEIDPNIRPLFPNNGLGT